MTTVMALLLVVRVFDRSGDSLQDRQAALHAADAILQQADHPPLGRLFQRRHAGGARLRRVPRTRRVADPDYAGAQPQLGYSLITPAASTSDGSTGVLGTVFSDRIAWLATFAGERPSVLLGRAIAHEIGHLLLGTNEHSPDGLMRAVWMPADVRHHRREDWMFTAADAARLRHSRVTGQDRRLAERASPTARPSS